MTDNSNSPPEAREANDWIYVNEKEVFSSLELISTFSHESSGNSSNSSIDYTTDISELTNYSEQNYDFTLLEKEFLESNSQVIKQDIQQDEIIFDTCSKDYHSIDSLDSMETAATNSESADETNSDSDSDYSLDKSHDTFNFIDQFVRKIRLGSYWIYSKFSIFQMPPFFGKIKIASGCLAGVVCIMFAYRNCDYLVNQYDRFISRMISQFP